MFKITNKQALTPDTKRLEVDAPAIARKIKPGQFVMATPEVSSESIPLAVVEADAQRGRLTLIVQEVGLTTKKIASMGIGDSIFSLLGPLGVPVEIISDETILCVGYGLSVIPLLSICRAFRKADNKVVGLVGLKTKKNSVLESQLRLSCHKFFITTEDGSFERRGKPLDLLPSIIKNEKINLVYVSGPANFLKEICEATSKAHVKTNAIVYPVMLDGTGQCGSCRVKVAGRDILACVDGPVFDGHQIDFRDLESRML